MNFLVTQTAVCMPSRSRLCHDCRLLVLLLCVHFRQISHCCHVIRNERRCCSRMHGGGRMRAHEKARTNVTPIARLFDSLEQPPAIVINQRDWFVGGSGRSDAAGVRESGGSPRVLRNGALGRPTPVRPVRRWWRGSRRVSRP